MAKRKLVFVGRVDGKPLRPPLVDHTVKKRWFRTIRQAEACISKFEKHDPTGVSSGAYYIDAPEEMNSARHRSRK